MICVTIGRGRHRSMLEEWKAAAAAGAELVELRIDCLRREPDLKRLLAERFSPIILTIRRGADGGLWRGPEEKRQLLLREAIAMGVEYIDLEMDVASKIRRYGATKRIISYHNMKTTPDELGDIAEQCDEMDADIVKVATMAHSVEDALRVLEVGARGVVPTIAIAMGAVGFFTRVLGAKYGAPFTYSGFNPDRIFAPAMPLFQQLKKEYYYDHVNSDTEVYAVIGDPIAQSLSPAVHNTSFQHLGLNKVYVPILIPHGRLRQSLEELTWLDLKGFSVTIPHKESIVPLLDKADRAVDLTGSCNTVVNREGKRFGYNTDYRAAMEVLEEALGGRIYEDVSPLMDKQVLILGAGGVARSIAFGLMRRGAGVTVCNRDDERATRLAEAVDCRSTSWGMRAGSMVDIVINCTPVGMHPNVDETPMPPAGFKPGMVAFDTVYHPENTMFLKLARERECLGVSGVEMFVRQAALQFKLFTGQEAPIDLMRDVVRGKLGPFPYPTLE